MKYLKSEPFSSKPSTDKYREGWEATFGSEDRYHFELGRLGKWSGIGAGLRQPKKRRKR